MHCCTNGDCCGPGSWCCAHAGPHSHEEEVPNELRELRERLDEANERARRWEYVARQLDALDGDSTMAPDWQPPDGWEVWDWKGIGPVKS